MNYALQVVRGRAGNTTIKLVNGVNSIGRHDDCLIRIRSSQVSRRHCELVEDGQTLMLRDLGSSNGTFVNGKRVLGQQRVGDGDVITVGAVTLRVEKLRSAATPAPDSKAGSAPEHDTAEVAALPAGGSIEESRSEPDEEFEVAIEDDPDHIGLIPLDDDEPAPAPARPAKPAAAAGGAQKPAASRKSAEPEAATETKSSPDEEAAVAQFLMDLKLDEEE